MRGKTLPQGTPIHDPGKPATYNGPTGTPRIPKQPVKGKLPDEVPGELVEVSESAIRIPRDGMTITKEGVAMCISLCIQWGVGKETSISQAARKLNIHRHTLTRLLANYENGLIGAISIIDDVDIDEFNDIVVNDMMAGYFDRVDMTDMANQEIKRRLEENPAEISTKALLDIGKNSSQQTLNTMKFLMEKAEIDKKSENKTTPVSTDQVSEVREILNMAANRLQDSEDRHGLIIDND